MHVTLGSDHAGYRLKLIVAQHLRSLGDTTDDVGTFSEEPVDYPEFCAAAARAAASGAADFAIVLGGSGQGEAIAANKVHGVRAALCQDEAIARLAREHNNANVLSLGARIVAVERALSVVDVFRETAFAGGRHVPRIAAIQAIEELECEPHQGK